MEELDTALALKMLKMQCADSIPIPDDSHYNVMTLAWDDVDRLEETLGGGGTFHSQWKCGPTLVKWTISHAKSLASV